MNNLFVFISCNAIYELEYLKRFWIVLAKNFKSCFCDRLNQWKWMQRSAKTKAKTKTVQIFSDTGRSFSDALLFPEHRKSMLCTKIVLNVRNNFCTQNVLLRFELGIFMCWTWNLMNNLSSYCGLVDAKIRSSDKDRFTCTNSDRIGTHCDMETWPDSRLTCMHVPQMTCVAVMIKCLQGISCSMIRCVLHCS